MQKKKTTTTAQPAKPTETFASFDDFFTQFLDKKKRNYTKKLEKIDQLKTKNADELTTEQRDLVANRAKVVEDAAYYDEIKSLYFQASSKKDGSKAATTSQSGSPSVVGLYYLARSVKEQGENALRVVSSQGVEFQEKLHTYHRSIFGQEGTNNETIKSAEAGVNAFAQDTDFAEQVNKIWSENQLNQKVAEAPAPVAKEVRKESNNNANKPQLFAMSSDEDEEEVEEKPAAPVKKTAETGPNGEFKPTFVPLPEDDNEDNFAFEGGNNNRGDRGDRRNRKPRGDRPYRKYDGEDRPPREDRPYKKYDGERRENREDRPPRDDRPPREDRPAREGEDNRERRNYRDANRDNRDYREGNRDGNREGNRDYREGNREGNRDNRDGNREGNRDYREGNREGNREGFKDGNREGNRDYRGKPSRGREYDRPYEGNRGNRDNRDNRDANREGGDRRPYGGRGRGGNFDKAPRDDNAYPKREGKVEKQE